MIGTMMVLGGGPFGVPLPFFNLYLMEIKASKNS